MSGDHATHSQLGTESRGGRANRLLDFLQGQQFLRIDGYEVGVLDGRDGSLGLWLMEREWEVRLW